MKRHLVGVVAISGFFLGSLGCGDDLPAAIQETITQGGSADAATPVAPDAAPAMTDSGSVAPAPPATDASAPPATPDAGAAPAGSTDAEVSDGGPTAVPDAAAPADAGAPLGDVEKQLLALIEQGKTKTVSDSMITPLYKKLAPVSIEFMTSVWHGSLFDGSYTGGTGWWGKDMRNPNDVRPMLMKAADGTIEPNSDHAKLSLATRDGLSESVVLTYTVKPISDYFRKVDENTVIGLTPGITFYFALKRDNLTKIGK